MDQWLSEYGESHQNPANKMIHYVCVPLITYSTLGLFDVTSQYMGLGFSLALPVILLGSLFYMLLNWKLGVILGLTTTAMVASFRFYPNADFQLYSQLLIFFASWALQFIGHKWEEAKPSFLKDLTFLLIGPLWVADKVSAGLLRAKA